MQTTILIQCQLSMEGKKAFSIFFFEQIKIWGRVVLNSQLEIHRQNAAMFIPLVNKIRVWTLHGEVKHNAMPIHHRTFLVYMHQVLPPFKPKRFVSPWSWCMKSHLHSHFQLAFLFHLIMLKFKFSFQDWNWQLTAWVCIMVSCPCMEGRQQVQNLDSPPCRKAGMCC